jgi:hypothetical protein
MAKRTSPPKNLPSKDTQSGLFAPLARFFAEYCRRWYFRAVESVGYHKRDLLLSRVETARDSFEEAKEQFQSALEKFSHLAHFHGGELENVYLELKAEFDYSQAKADGVRDRIDAIQAVGDALFEEWQEELEQYSNRALKASSKQQMRQTQQHYARLVSAMRRAEARIEPVLAAFRDQVLFLKHNLNAQAIASLENELSVISINVTGLIQAMERSISEANTFVESFNRPKSLPANTP